ncbi:MAG: hypothetical protein M1833_003728 [Piccolia ochrophora]|nr:MAG: hypothetical protein M1833_003728 [Piccolia ochrophora]
MSHLSSDIPSGLSAIDGWADPELSMNPYGGPLIMPQYLMSPLSVGFPNQIVSAFSSEGCNAMGSNILSAEDVEMSRISAAPDVSTVARDMNAPSREARTRRAPRDASPDERLRGRRTSKQKRSENDKISSSKQKGRPRLPGNDESAIERRRTQIRLAQRAYRYRKETTISTLQDRVHTLEDTVDTMHQKFNNFTSLALSSGIASLTPGLAHSLETTSQEISSLMERTKTALQQESGDDAPDVPDKLTSNPQTIESTSQQLSPTWNYEFGVNDPSSHHKIGVSSPQQPSLSRQTSYGFERGVKQSLPQYHHVTRQTPLYSQPSTANLTRSAHESSFGRRLHRTALERAYHLVVNPHLDEEALHRVFKITFCFSQREMVSQRLSATLDGRAQEGLDIMQSPFIRLGNASMHFPPKGTGADRPIPDTWTVSMDSKSLATIKPLNSPLPAQPEVALDLRGYEGDWFDAHDVERYLQAKGVKLDNQSSFAQVPLSGVGLDMHEFIPSGHIASGTGPQRVQRQTSSSDSSSSSASSGPESAPSFVRTQGDLYTNPPFIPQGTPSENYHLKSNNTPSTPIVSYANNGQYGWGDFETMLTLDISKLIDELTHRGICLGRVPGFKREDVEHAFTSALQVV